MLVIYSLTQHYVNWSYVWEVKSKAVKCNGKQSIKLVSVNLSGYSSRKCVYIIFKYDNQEVYTREAEKNKSK